MHRSASSLSSAAHLSVSLQNLLAACDQKDAHFCLFLDIDGTLSEFQQDPADSFIPAQTLDSIEQIIQLNIPVIAVTGRHVQVAQTLFHPLELPVAGLHGLDIYMDRATRLTPDLGAINFTQLKQELSAACQAYPELLIEDKEFSVALHYRQCPQHATTAQQIMQRIGQGYPQLKLHEGKCVVELLPHAADKGQAIHTILEHLALDAVFPVFIGDDKTDESGFNIINQYQGISIKVGPGETQASYRLPDIKTVADFLVLFSQFLQKRALRQTQAPDGERVCLN